MTSFLHLTFSVTSSRVFRMCIPSLKLNLDAEQRYAIKHLVRKKKTRQETLCEIKEVYGLAALQKRRYKSCTSDFPKAIILQLICLEPDLMER